MKTSTVTPERTYALVVGIEECRPDMKLVPLDGPAHDTQRFTEWLLEKGVPKENILLFLSPLEKNLSVIEIIERRGLVARSATQDNIRLAITTGLPQLGDDRQEEGDCLLYIFWGGHGVTSLQDDTRRLYYTDTHKADRKNLDINSLLLFLKSDGTGNFEHQICLIDACGDYLHDIRTEILPSGELPRPAIKKPGVRCKQYALFATGIGEVALNYTKKQTGQFSEVVLETLKEETEVSWLPNMEKVVQVVQQRFNQLKEKKDAKQTPTVWYRDWTGNEHLLDSSRKSASIFQVPYRRNPYFTGRQDFLEHLHTILMANKAAALTQALSGLGGIGKTQVAIEYAYRHHEDYSAIFWIQADSDESLAFDFLQIAHSLNLPEKDFVDDAEQDKQKQQLIMDAIKYWLQIHPGWLLIFDNVEDIGGVNHFLPSLGKGHILLTTRSQVTRPVAQPLNMERMQTKDGVLFLLRRAGMIPIDGLLDLIPESDYTPAEEIVQIMDGLPLALDQAGAFIEGTGCSLTGYIEIYKKEHTLLLKERGYVFTDHPESVSTTFSLAFKKVKKAEPAAIDLLYLCAFLYHENISEAIFTDGASYLNRKLQTVATNPLKLRKAVGELLKYSLLYVNRANQSLAIHRLVQQVLRDQMKAKEKQIWAERTVKVVLKTFPQLSYDNQQNCQIHLSHSLECAKFIKEYSLFSQEAADLLYRAGIYLATYESQHAQAKLFFLQALPISERLYGSEDLLLIPFIDALADAQIELGLYEQAEQVFQRILRIGEKRFIFDSPQHAMTLASLANLYRMQSRNEQSEQLYLQALHIKEHPFTSDYVDYYKEARSSKELQNLVHKGGTVAAAPFMKRMLVLLEEELGSNHPTVQDLRKTVELMHTPEDDDKEFVQILTGLARLYLDQQRYEEAEPLLERAIRICKQLDPESKLTAHTMELLANLYEHEGIGGSSQAEELRQQALVIKGKILSTDDPAMTASIHDLGRFYLDRDRYEEAEPLLQKAVENYERVLGPEHFYTSIAYKSLARLFIHQNRYENAEALFLRALTIEEKIFGPEHPKIMGILINLASLHQTQQRYEKAEQLLKRVLTIAEKVFGPEHPEVAIALDHLALFYREQKRYKELEPVLLQAVAIAENSAFEYHHITATLTDLALFYQEQGQMARAEVLYRRVLDTYEKFYTVKYHNDAFIFEVTANFAGLISLCLHQERYTEAEALCIKVMKICESVLGSTHDQTLFFLKQIVYIYQNQGKYVEAKELLEQIFSTKMQSSEQLEAETIENILKLGSAYYKQGKYTEAEPLLHQVVASQEQTLGLNHLGLAHSLNSASAVYWSQGKYTESEHLLKRALALFEQISGSDQEQIPSFNYTEFAHSLHNLGALYWRQGKYSEAEHLLKRALALFEQISGPEHSDTARSLSGLAEIYRKQGKAKKAEQLMKQAMAIRERVLGSEHHETLQSISNIASFYLEQGKFEEAEPLLSNLVITRERILGPEHPDYARSLNHLATLFHYQKKDRKAEHLYRQSLEIREKALNSNHPDIAESLISLAGFLEDKGQYAKAELLLERAIQIQEQVFGHNHRFSISTRNMLVNLYDKQGKYEAIKLLLASSSQINELIDEDPYLSLSLEARAYRKEKKYEEAEAIYQHLLALSEEKNDMFNMAKLLYILSELYGEQGKRDEAMDYYLRILAVYEQEGNTVALVHMLKNVAFMHIVENKLEEALNYYLRLLSLLDQEKDWAETAKTLNAISSIYLRLKNLEEALDYSKQALLIWEQREDDDPSGLVEALNNIGLIYYAWHQWDEALNYGQRLYTLYKQKGDPAQLASALSNIANIYQEQGEFKEALDYHQQVQAMQTQGIDTPTLASSLSRTGQIHHQQGKIEEAIGYYRQALVLQEKKLGPERPETALVAFQLAHLYSQQEQYEQAEPLYIQALVLDKESGPQYSEKASVTWDLAQMYHRQKRYEEAEPLYIQALTAWEKELGPEHPDVAAALCILATFYHVQKQYKQAEAYYQRALAILTDVLKGEHHYATDIPLYLTAYAQLLRESQRGEKALEVEAQAQEWYNKLNNK